MNFPVSSRDCSKFTHSEVRALNEWSAVYQRRLLNQQMKRTCNRVKRSVWNQAKNEDQKDNTSRYRNCEKREIKLKLLLLRRIGNSEKFSLSKKAKFKRFFVDSYNFCVKSMTYILLYCSWEKRFGKKNRKTGN